MSGILHAQLIGADVDIEHLIAELVGMAAVVASLDADDAEHALAGSNLQPVLAGPSSTSQDQAEVRLRPRLDPAIGIPLTIRRWTGPAMHASVLDRLDIARSTVDLTIAACRAAMEDDRPMIERPHVAALRDVADLAASLNPDLDLDLITASAPWGDAEVESTDGTGLPGFGEVMRTRMPRLVLVHVDAETIDGNGTQIVNRIDLRPVEIFMDMDRAADPLRAMRIIREHGITQAEIDLLERRSRR